MTMSEMIELSENEIEMIAGGRPTVGPVTVQENIDVTPQVAVSTGVLTKYSNISASNFAIGLQLNGI
jgi:hypothetical protein